jgi:biotin operon repressor
MGRAFGIEMEYFAPGNFLPYAIDSTVTHLGNAGIVAHSSGRIQRTAAPTWSVKPDGSLDRNLGVELVSPILKDLRGRENVRQVMTAAQAIGLQVNPRCGIHVHVDARDLSPQEVAAVAWRFAQFQQNINSNMPPHRNANRYCEPVTRNQTSKLWALASSTTPSNSVADAMSYNRYHTINLQRHADLGTIEFRQLEATHDANRVTAWIAFCVNFVNATVEKMRAGGTQVSTTPRRLTNPYRHGTKNALCFNALNGNWASADLLMSLTGWRPQTISSMVSDIRSKGFQVEKRTQLGTTEYRLVAQMVSNTGYSTKTPAEVRGELTDGLPPQALAWFPSTQAVAA